MKGHLIVASLTALALVVVAAVVMPTPVAGQARAGAPASQAPPRAADGKPDFSGFYQAPVGAERGPRFSAAKMSPFKPGGEALFFEMHNGDPFHDEPRDFCWPSGFPWGFLAPYPVQIIQTPQYLVMVHEFQRLTRIIPLDGRSHSTNAEPSYQGDSVGHWEGDTLVIDTTNYKRWILDDYHYVDSTKNRMHSDAFHTIERIRRPALNSLSWSITIDDPKIFTAPWTEDFSMTFHPEWAKDGLFEFVCQENNRCEGGKCKGPDGK